MSVLLRERSEFDMTRIVHLLGTAGGSWGGMERHTLDLAMAQAEAGQNVYLLADAGYASRVPSGVEFHALDVRRSRRSPLLWWQCRRLLKRLRPNVVHAQGAKAAALLSAQSRWLQRAGCVCVGTVHGTKSSHKAYARLNASVAVSSAIAAQLKHPRIEVIPNGVAPHDPDPEVLADCRALRAGWSGALLLTIGRLVPVKGYDVLLQAWPDTADAHLLILGDGPEREALQSLVNQRGLQERVTFAGHSTAVTEWLHVADAMVISSHREGFPYVLVEALQAGCPVLSTAVSGVSEILPPAALTEPGDITGLNVLLANTLPVLADLRRSQEPQFVQARTQLTLTAMAGSTLKLYDSLRKPMHV